MSPLPYLLLIIGSIFCLFLVVWISERYRAPEGQPLVAYLDWCDLLSSDAGPGWYVLWGNDRTTGPFLSSRDAEDYAEMKEMTNAD